MYSYGSPTYGWAKAGRPARTYIQQLCEDTGCSPEDLPEAMNDWEKWREWVRDIRASGTTWWRLLLFPPGFAGSFHWSQRDSKSPQVSWTLLNVLADLNNAVVWVFSILPLISSSTSLSSKFLGGRSMRANYN